MRFASLGDIVPFPIFDIVEAVILLSASTSLRVMPFALRILFARRASTTPGLSSRKICEQAFDVKGLSPRRV